MTESIFAPFVINTEESAKKVLEVLMSEPTPLPKGTGATCKFLSKDEAIACLEQRRH